MSPHATPGTIVLVALKTITLILGGMITYFSYKAYRRSGARPLWYLAVGFGIVTAGTFLAGAIDQAIRFSLFGVNVPFFGGNVDNQTVADFALAIESALTATGFAVIVYSLYSE
ncbi:DUF7521 family protein [Halosimplex pelagicum]|uniref:Uncharacterized protein n=1 Tax=Halosimplex pelagicum TaxID=869886 RepID=A0A7D5T688_9EURY|nr:hypothetical protein [Halosimplex pelagicum]QLH83068.1 hypothetical protein HZS54_16190 [Halosimplex pelagicum]